jgi:uncharacterized phiE125 gp8 family phage protein
LAEPITLAEAKAQVRMVEDDSEDTFITSLIAPARAYVERVTRLHWVEGERTQTFRGFGNYLELWRHPVVSVDAITYSVSSDPDDDTAYEGFVTNLGFPVKISPAYGGSGWPEMVTGGTVTVTYTAGALAATSEESLIGKRAMLLLIGHWFENRETAVIGQASNEVDFAVRSLLDEIRPISAY